MASLVAVWALERGWKQEVHKGQGLEEEGRKKGGSASDTLYTTDTKWNLHLPILPAEQILAQAMRMPLLTVMCQRVSVFLSILLYRCGYPVSKRKRVVWSRVGWRIGPIQDSTHFTSRVDAYSSWNIVEQCRVL